MSRIPSSADMNKILKRLPINYLVLENNYFAPLLCLHTILHIYVLASDLESIANKRLQHLLSLIFTSHQTTAENRLMIESLLLPRIELVPEREIPRKKMVGIATQGSGV